jgi:choline dehydrogenase-like flavoprotein
MVSYYATSQPSRPLREPVTRTRYDFIMVGGRPTGGAPANRLSTDPGNRVLVLGAGHSDFRWDVFNSLSTQQDRKE